MEQKAVTAFSQTIRAMFWLVLLLIAAGFVLHLAHKYNILPGVTSWIGQHADLSTQAGG